MPPRFAYWTILAGGLPTSFRSADREDLLPTLRRLKERQPDAEMRWFQRGKLWESPEAVRAALQKAVVPRGPDWRPGGEHRDPRAGFKEKKRERNQDRRQQRFRRKHGSPEAEDTGRERTRIGQQTGTGRPRVGRPVRRQKPNQGRRR